MINILDYRVWMKVFQLVEPSSFSLLLLTPLFNKRLTPDGGEQQYA